MIARDLANAYGVLVRAGAITPQQPDEDAFRTALALPDAGLDVSNQWLEDGGVRRPITLSDDMQ